MERLNVRALAIAGGVVWALAMLFIGWTSWLFDWGTGFVSLMSSIYLGFKPTFAGAVIGALWALIDGALAGALIAWVYNKAAGK